MPANVESMFYVREAPWHGLGIRVEEALSSEEALRESGLDWKVIQRPIMTAAYEHIPGYKANIRDTDNRVLGVVTDRYKIVQNRKAFAFVDEEQKRNNCCPTKIRVDCRKTYNMQKVQTGAQETHNFGRIGRSEIMPYITIKQPPKFYQMTFEEIMAGVDDLSKYVMPNITNTRTYWVDRPNAGLLQKTDVPRMVGLLNAFSQSKEALFAQDRASLYHTFHIPKSSGGLRRIDAPLPELMTALRELKTIFETQMFALYHTTAFAYVPGRSTVDALKRHQRNESKWFSTLNGSHVCVRYVNIFGKRSLRKI